MVLPRGFRRDSAITFKQDNPKREGGTAHKSYQKYKSAKTVAQALALGAYEGDITYDFSRGFVRKSTKDDAAQTREAIQQAATKVKKSFHKKPFKHVLSLGNRCLMADTLKRLELRQYSGPFDWIYSNTEMVTHILRNRFKIFLDKQLLTVEGSRGHAGGHKVYSKMLDRAILFPHHQPKNKDYDRLRLHVSRFNKVLKLKQQTLFTMCEVVESGVQYDTDDRSKYCAIFDALCNLGIGQFELLVVVVVIRKASTASRQPIVKPAVGLKSKGRAVLQLAELHCVGDCTGLFLKSKKDVQAFEGLITRGRRFDLQPDPLTEAESKRIVGAEAYHQRHRCHPVRD